VEDKPFIVLAKVVPTSKKCADIGRALTYITKQHGLIPFKNKEIKRNPKAAWFNYELHAEVRKTAVKDSEATSWHQDGDTSTNQMNFAMVVWADRQPTEFKVGEKIYKSEPYELVIAKNLSCFHRRPNIDGERYFFRQRVEIPKHIKLL